MPNPSSAAAASTPAVAPRGIRQHKKAVTRREILLAARRLFGDRGLYESRIEDMTERAGIAKGTLYLYFHSKEDLIRAVAVSALDDLEERIDRGTRGARSLPDLLRRIVEAHLAFFAENPDLLRILHQVRGMVKFDRREWRPLRSALAEHLKRLARRLDAPCVRPKLSPARRRMLATLLFGGVSGAASAHVSSAPDDRAGPLPRTVAGAFVKMAMAYAIGVNS